MKREGFPMDWSSLGGGGEGGEREMEKLMLGPWAPY